VFHKTFQLHKYHLIVTCWLLHRAACCCVVQLSASCSSLRHAAYYYVVQLDFTSFHLAHGLRPMFRNISLRFHASMRAQLMFRNARLIAYVQNRHDGTSPSCPSYLLLVSFSGHKFYKLTGSDCHTFHGIFCCHGINAGFLFQKFFQSAKK